MLKTDDLFGEHDKVAIAIERIKMEVGKGRVLAFSGGKDSVVIYRLAQLAGVDFQAVYRVPGIDPPELTRFIKTFYPEVKREIPEKSFFQGIIEKEYPTRQCRWCCVLIKENGCSGKQVITGVRWEESKNRANRRMTELCYKDPSKSYLNPIIDWTADEVWEFIYSEKIPYCELYDQGWDRIGCLFCPMNTKRTTHLDLYPSIASAFIRAFEARYEYSKKKGLNMAKRWKSGEEAFYFWLFEEKGKKKNPGQMVLFE